MKKIIKGTICFALTAGMLFSCALAGEKEEVVYANLSPEGTVDNVYIVNILKPEDGVVTDFGSYKSVANMSAPDQPTTNGDEITVKSNKDKVFLQGEAVSNHLPWDVIIEYYLNGENKKPQDILGQEGKLEINLRVNKNQSISQSYFDDFALQASMTLDGDVFSNILADGATIANMGADKQISYMALPGKGMDVKVSADVKDFVMGEISINGVSLKMDIDTGDVDVSSFTGDLGELGSGTEQLHAGTATLADGFKGFQAGISGIEDGAAALSGGLDTLAQNGDGVVSGGQQLADGMLAMANSQLKAAFPTTKSLTWANYTQVLSELMNVNDEMRAAAKSQISQQTGLVGDELDMLLYVASGKLDKSGVTPEKINGAIGEAGKVLGKAQADMPIVQKAQQDLVSAKGNPIAVPALKQVLTAMVMQQTGIINPAQVTDDMLLQAYVSIASSLSGAKEEEKALILVMAASINQGDFTKAIQQSAIALENIATVQKAGSIIKTQEGKNGIDALLTQLVKTSGSELNQLSDLMAGLSGAQYFVSQLKTYTGGVNQSAIGAKELNKGIGKLGDGAGELGNGINQLEQATKALKDATANIEGDAKSRIDEAIENITGDMFPDKPAVSFASEKNGEIKSLQFSMKTSKLTKPSEQKKQESAQEKKSFMDKLKDLF